MRETFRAQVRESFKYVLICSTKIQNMHKLLLSNVWDCQRF